MHALSIATNKNIVAVTVNEIIMSELGRLAVGGWIAVVAARASAHHYLAGTTPI